MSGTRRKPGRLGPVVEGYRLHLLSLGYTPGTVRGMLKTLGRVGRWMQAEGLEPAELDEVRIEQFLSMRHAEGHLSDLGLRSFVPLLQYLRDEHVIAVRTAAPLTAVDRLVVTYRDWLINDRGLAAPTALRYENAARRFLLEHAGSVGEEDEVRVELLTGLDVSQFLLAECARVSVGAAKGRVAELRSLLRFLHLRGLTQLDLAVAVPPVAGWHHTGIPKTLTVGDVQRLVDSCDRSDPIGTRDYALVILVARLGLRSAEVARMELGDVDWRAGEVLIHGKARRSDRLPLPVEVGEALAAYLHDARPRTKDRAVFVTCRAPRRGIRPDLVSDVVRRACVRCDMAPVGAHRLRHALATNMLAKGASLVEISQVLRHQDLATTAIYAKVDLAGLRTVARTWPGAQR
jgi:site-specific recombinase XerD